MNLSSPWHRLYILLGFNLLFIGFYFSGIPALHALIVPTIEGLHPSQHREFGIMEWTQNLFLLAIVVLSAQQVFSRTLLVERILFLVGFLCTLVILLEELDYGIHFWEFFTGETAKVKVRNWHNQWVDGTENATRLKSINDAVMLLGFLLLPLLRFIPAVDRLLGRFLFLPSRSFFFLSLAAVLCSRVAHVLDDQGIGIITGDQGSLYQSIGEFRETSVYYIYLMYVLDLVRSSSLFGLSGTQQSSG